MSRPTKFDVMRAKRKPPAQAEREDLLRRIDELEAEMSAEWHVEMRELRGVREIDIDAVHKRKNTVRRWWWPLCRGSA